MTIEMMKELVNHIVVNMPANLNPDEVTNLIAEQLSADPSLDLLKAIKLVIHDYHWGNDNHLNSPYVDEIANRLVASIGSL